jgi:cytochrome P450
MIPRLGFTGSRPGSDKERRMNTAGANTAEIPPHVPRERVHDYPFRLGATCDENPFDILVPKVHEGPEVFYTPCVYPGFRPAWIFRRAKDLATIYQDTEHFSNKDFAPFAMLVGDTWSSLPAETDPPMHALYRAMVNPLFAPRKIAALDNRVREFARDYVGRFKGKGKCEFMSEFAFRFPIAVFLELMNLPLERIDEFLEWEMMLLHSADVAVIAAGVRKVKAYLLGVIEERRVNPGDDFVSFGIAAEIQGRKLTQDELFGFCFNLFIGGLDTVSTNMGLHFRHLAERPDDQELLRKDPGKIPGAVEELMRAYSAVTTFRTVIEPVKVHDVQLMPGDKVAMVTTLANRDPDAFERPNEVLLDRNPRHITFATGPHRCVGAPLARRELIIAMEEFLGAIPTFRIEPGVTIRTDIGLMIQPQTVPLVWTV